MAVFPLRFRIALVMLVSCFVLSTGLLNLKDQFTWKRPWDGVQWTDSPRGLRAESVEVGSPAARSGLKVSDILLRIDDTPILSIREYTDLIYKFRTGHEATYLIQSSSTGIISSKSLQISAKSDASVPDLFRIVVAFAYLFIGFHILLHGRSRGSLHFYLLCLVSYMVYSFRYTTKLEPIDYLVYWSSSIGLLILPALFLHFCLVFSSTQEIGIKNRLQYWVYLPCAVLLFAHVRWFSGNLSFIGFPRNIDVRVLLDKINLAYYSICFVLGASVLFHTFRSTKNRVLRQQMKWIVYGSSAAVLPFLLLYAVPYLYLGRGSNLVSEASVVSLVLIPLSFGYAIIKYKLMDVDVLFKNKTAYFITSSIVLCVYFLLIVLGGKLGEYLAPEAGFLSVSIAALMAAFLFTPLRNKVQTKIDHFFYKDQYDYRESLIEFGKTLSSEISMPRLSRLILERISKTFDVSRSAILLKDEHNADYSYRVIDSMNLDVPFSRVEISQLGRLDLEYFQPLVSQGREIGLVGLGRKRDDNFFSKEDRELLEALSGYAAIALENASLYRSVETKAYEYAQLKDYSENIIESINVGVLVLDLEGTVTGCNSAFEELYGVGRDTVVRRRIEEVFSCDFIQAVKEAAGNKDWVFNHTQNIYKLYLDTKKNGNGAIINISITPLVDRTDNVNGTLIIFDDISERIKLENQLLQAEKLSSIGLLAAGIAHEINTPIAGISSYTQMLIKQVQDSDPKKEVLAKIERQTFRASEIINSLLNFSRLNGTELKPVDINSLIRETLSLLDHQFNTGKINVQSDLDQELPMVIGNSGKLQQVLINLFLNAKDAMPGGGLLTIVTSQNDTMVVIDIRDTGTGISQENIKRIYDPFFTTKGGKGTGLGLAVSYGIIQEHSGRIFVESMPGRGTQFKLKLPAQVN